MCCLTEAQGSAFEGPGLSLAVQQLVGFVLQLAKQEALQHRSASCSYFVRMPLCSAFTLFDCCSRTSYEGLHFHISILTSYPIYEHFRASSRDVHSIEWQPVQLLCSVVRVAWQEVPFVGPVLASVLAAPSDSEMVWREGIGGTSSFGTGS